MKVASATGLGHVSVIISTRDRPDMLDTVVRSILAGDVVPDELVIVDQSEHLSPQSWPNVGCCVRHLHPQLVGLSRANNHGVMAASHDTLLFTHDDVIVDSRWLAELAEAVGVLGEAGAATGRVSTTEPEVDGGFAPALRDETAPVTHRGRVGHDVLKPMNLGMRRPVFDRVGGFDCRLGPGTVFPGAEDSDLGFRILEAGFRIDFVPQAIVFHRAWRPGSDYLPLRWQYGMAQGAFYAKHLTRNDLHMLRRAGRDLRRRIRRFPSRVRHEGSRALGDPIFIAANIVGAARWWLANRRARQS